MNYSISEISSILGQHQGRILDPDAIVSQLLTDSRSLTQPRDTLFFALRTANNDGHNYIADLFERGVRNFVVASDYYAPPECYAANYLAVDSPLDALQAIATYHRRRFRELPVIGITGSRGKTTVKEWLYQLLHDDYRIVRSPRSYNSQIGVPLSLWDIDNNTDLAIIEAGISTTGEMDNLQAMIRPTIGILTNLGSEHNDGFESMTQKAQEKAKILNSCEAIVYCADDPLVTHTIAPLLESDVTQQMAWSRHHNDAPLQVQQVARTEGSTTLQYVHRNGEPQTITIPFNTDRDIDNAITCLAVLLHLGISSQVIAERMAALTPVGTRLNVIEGVNECTVIADSYTSDYNSLTPALNFMARRAGNRPSTVILSDLATESYSGDELYIRVSELLKNKQVHRLLGVGDEMCNHARFFDDLPVAHFYATTQQLLDAMSQGDFESETILVKGAPQFGFSQIIDLLEAKQHMTVMEVDLNAVVHNFKFFKSLIHPGTRTVGMVKASAYGTGSYEIAKTLQDCGCDYLAVAVQDEGVELRKAGINMPIIVLNPSGVNLKAMFQYRLEPEVYSLAMAQALIKEGARRGVTQFPVHIKVDTGMHRLGFTLDELPELITLLQGQQVLTAASVFSHLCAADEPDHDAYTQQQFQTFDQCCDLLQSAFDHHIMRHILNTSGIVRFPERQYDMVRIGIGLYGIRTLGDDSEDALQPVATLRSLIISIHQWPAGTTIGYGQRGLLQRDSRIATVTIGYADGFDRHFGNGNASVWVNGTLCPTVGNVCMDAVMIDVTDAQCQVGDTVEIFGNNVPIEALSQARATIPYEVLTSVSPRVKRVYYRE